MELDHIVRFAVKHGISDIHFKVGKPPRFRHNGVLVLQKGVPPVTEEMMGRWLHQTARADILEEYQTTKEADFAFSVEGVGRFRVNAFVQRERMAMVLRHIPQEIKSIAELELPPVLESLALEPRGLILVTGATGSGKSTTLAAMIDHLNTNRPVHVVTIEDPIEFIFEDKQAVINQREVGVDTQSFPRALKAALRQDPDAILIGELRDLETVETALHAAETGHLVISTLHTIDATETIGRMIALFPPHQQHVVRLQLSQVLKGVVSQRLVRTKEGGRCAACEVMVGTSFIRDLIADPERTHELPTAISQGATTYGMQTFDQALGNLMQSRRISLSEALAHATNPAEIKLLAEGIG